MTGLTRIPWQPLEGIVYQGTDNAVQVTDQCRDLLRQVDTAKYVHNLGSQLFPRPKQQTSTDSAYQLTQ